jgi:hypothetical protein
VNKLCEFDTHRCSSSDCEIFEPCGLPTVLEYKGEQYCLAHYCHMLVANAETDAEARAKAQ